MKTEQKGRLLLPVICFFVLSYTVCLRKDITLLPALANIFETSVDLLLGMDTIRAEETRLNIHKKAIAYQRSGELDLAEKTYREALLIYPNKPGIILGDGEGIW